MSEETQGSAPQETPPAATPPPGQAQPQPPPGPAPVPDPHNLGPTSLGMAAHVAAALSYIWIVGLIFYFVEKTNKFVRFHAMQSILLGVAWIIIGYVLGFMILGAMFSGGAGGFGLGFLLVQLINLCGFVLWIICIVQAATGKWFKIPIIGDMAQKWS